MCTPLYACLNFGVASVVIAQPRPVKLTVSGTAGPSAIDLGAGTPASEYALAGNGTLGSFTFRTVSSTTALPEVSDHCAGPSKLYFSTTAGMGVFRASDGSLLQVNLTDGSDCIDFAAGNALCIRIYEVVGGTGRFKNAASDGGTVTLKMTVAPVVPNHFVFFVVTGEITGNLSE